MQTRAINFSTKVAKQQRSHRTIDQITEDRGHRQRPEMGANHRKVKPASTALVSDHADFVELQFLLHQRAELLPVGITTNASDNVLINGAESGLFSTSPMASLQQNTATHTTSPSPTFSQYSVVEFQWLISFAE